MMELPEPTKEQIALSQLGIAWTQVGDEPLVIHGERPTDEELDAAYEAWEAAEEDYKQESDTTADEDLRTAIEAASNLNELKAALLGTSPNARAQVAGRPT